jgi:RNA polymerase sigma-70 factor, ECF subfamily
MTGGKPTGVRITGPLAMTSAGMAERGLSLGPAVPELREADGEAPTDARRAAKRRLERMVSDHFDMLWRFLRQLGIPECDVDDGIQEVLMVAARRLTDIEVGRERAFLFSTAVRVASTLRRSRARHREQVVDSLVDFADPHPTPEASLDRARERQLLDAVLDEIPIELRAIFVLYELEELTMAEISALLELAPGTVASRLRRARERFAKKVRALELELFRRRGA